MAHTTCVCFVLTWRRGLRHLDMKHSYRGRGSDWLVAHGSQRKFGFLANICSGVVLRLFVQQQFELAVSSIDGHVCLIARVHFLLCSQNVN